MGRNRQTSRDDILDAAMRVITRLGATGLSIDAVAKEAGVSKATVVYDHKSKSALLEALIDRQMKADVAHTEACVAASADTPHPELFGRIASAEKGFDDADRAVALAISASMSNEDNLQKVMRDWTTKDLKLMAVGDKPKAALMAYLALTGFYCTELFSFHIWPDSERTEIIEGIRSIYHSFTDKA